MLQVTDVTQTRVFQEALEQGRQEGREEGRKEVWEKSVQEGIKIGIEEVANRMIDQGRAIAEIVKWTGLTAAQVRNLEKKRPK